MLKRVLRHPSFQTLSARAVGLYLAFALGTTRWRLVGAENLAPFARGTPVIMAAWHERLPLMPAQWMMVRRWKGGRGEQSRIHILISRSRDGRFIAASVRRFGIDAAAGSSSRGGAAAVRTLLRLLASGDHIGITPDGPRGPRRIATPGVAQLAALSGVPILPCSAQTSNGLVLNTWDRMVLPRPFGRGVVVCRPPIAVDSRGWRDALPGIEAELTAASDHADLVMRDREIWGRLYQTKR